jgi:glucosamine-6-phosphate deaminase
MKVVILDNEVNVAECGATIFKQQLKLKGDSVLGLAAGPSPVALHKKLIEAHQKDGLSFAKATTFNIDEYLGLNGKQPPELSAFHESAAV